MMFHNSSSQDVAQCLGGPGALVLRVPRVCNYKMSIETVELSSCFWSMQSRNRAILQVPVFPAFRVWISGRELPKITLPMDTHGI